MKNTEFFEDKDRTARDRYYKLLDRMDDGNISDEELLAHLEKLITRDPDFFDSYSTKAELLYFYGKRKLADECVKKAYFLCLNLITDRNGYMPKQILWSFINNRHILRIIMQYALLCWGKKNAQKALELLKWTLTLNENDNQGARHYILAIRLGLSPKTWNKPFLTEDKEFMDAHKLSDWFYNNAPKFPEDLTGYF